MRLALAYIGAGKMAQALSTFEDGCYRLNKMVLSGSPKIQRLEWVQSVFQLCTITVRSWMDAGMEISGNTAIKDLLNAAEAQSGPYPKG